MQKHLSILLALAALTITPMACDAAEQGSAEECPAFDGSSPMAVAPRLVLAAPAGAPPAAEYTFREAGDYLASYITKFKGSADIEPQPVDFDRFVEAYQYCRKQEPGLKWTLTLTRYKPDTTKRARVVGYGGSTLSQGPAIECWEKLWASNGETFIPQP